MTKHILKPEIDEESRPYWEGLVNDELLIQQCDDCDKTIFYPRTLCPHCFSEKVRWIKASGKGEIYSYTVVHRAFGPFKDDVPFVVALIDLDEGVRMMTRILGDRDEIEIGMRVEVTFKKLDDDFVLPYFELA